MKLDHLKTTVALMRELGIRRYRQGDTELELTPEEPPAAPSPETEKQLEALLQETGMPSEDDLLMWSTGEPLPSESAAEELGTVTVAAPPGVTVKGKG